MAHPECVPFYMDRHDLFGAVVQLAARLGKRAQPGSVLVSSAVHDLALGKGFVFRKHRRLSLKGFDEGVQSFEVIWQPPGPGGPP